MTKHSSATVHSCRYPNTDQHCKALIVSFALHSKVGCMKVKFCIVSWAIGNWNKVCAFIKVRFCIVSWAIGIKYV